ncbi:MAG: hypothetical protein BMS9Abin26_1480 [Gammaproteobacteria bacterium]|nr:MAG: hypothetical protein BMS9Abin26_1480 [Gammaproteobacteria bacterium]
MKLFRYIACSLLLFPLMVTNGAAGDRIRIGWVFAMANAPLIIAMEKGYFRELGYINKRLRADQLVDSSYLAAAH